MKESLADQLAKLSSASTDTSAIKLQKSKQVTDENCKIGSIIYLPMTSNDNGFVVKGVEESAQKMNVVVGFSEDYWAVATVLINSKSYGISPELADCQYPIKASDYPSFVKHDSFINCAKIFEIEKSRIKKDGEFKHELTETDLKNVIKCIEETGVVEPKLKKKFGIKDTSKENL